MKGPGNRSGTGARAVTVEVVEPYDFGLSLRAIHSFLPAPLEPGEVLCLAARLGGRPASVEIRPSAGSGGSLDVVSVPRVGSRRLRSFAGWVLNAGLDLKPFYRLAAKDPRLAPIVRKLRGLKPTRPASLFEMAVIAVTEQQISMAAAAKIRDRVVRKYGERAGDLWVFPEPAALAEASSRALLSCGLSHAKTRYIHNLSRRIVSGELELEALKTMSDDQARGMIMGLEGFGRWSADYILVRGLARPDAVPVDDLGVRSVVGESLGGGGRASAEEVTRRLEPFRPFRGLLAFYLLVGHRLPSGDTPGSSRLQETAGRG